MVNCKLFQQIEAFCVDSLKYGGFKMSTENKSYEGRSFYVFKQLFNKKLNCYMLYELSHRDLFGKLYFI